MAVEKKTIEEKSSWQRYAEALGLGSMSDDERIKVLMNSTPEDVLPGLSGEDKAKLYQTIALAKTVVIGDV